VVELTVALQGYPHNGVGRGAIFWGKKVEAAAALIFFADEGARCQFPLEGVKLSSQFIFQSSAFISTEKS